MMPPGHVAVGLLSRQLWNGQTSLDLRWLAGCALLPDIIDKPLAILVFTDSHSTQNMTHALLPHLLLLTVALFWIPRIVPYVLAFNTHLLADHMWYHTETFWYPLYGWQTFWQFKFMNTPQAMLKVYFDIVKYPEVWVVELFAMAYLTYFAWRNQLYRWQNIRYLLVAGHLKI